MTYDEDKENLNKETLLKNELFIDDAISFLIDRRGYKAEDLLDDEEVYDAFMSHFRSQNVNEATAIRDMIHAQNSDEEGKERMGRLMDAYDNMDSDFGFKALGDYAAGIFTAPSTYAGLISFGAGKAGALAANQGVKIGIREVLKRNALKQGKKPTSIVGLKGSGRKGVVVDGVVQEAKLAQKAMALAPAIRGGGLRAGLGAAGVEGTIGAGAVLAQEETRRETDIKENIDFSDVLIGGAASAVPGGLLGTVAGTKKFMDHYEATKVLKKSRDTIIDKVNKVYDDVTAPSLKIGEGTEAVKNKRRMRRDITKNMAKRLSLEETIGEQLEKGKRLKESLLETDAQTLATFDEKFKMNIASAGAEIVMRVGPRAKNIVAGSEEDLQERFTSRLVRGLSDPNVLSQEEFLKILNKYGIGEAEIEMLSIAEASELLGVGASEAGSLLGTISAASRRKQGAFMQKLDAFDLELKKAGEYKSVRARKEIEEKTGTVNAGTRKRTFLENLASARVGLMTVNVATTVRNTTSGYLRNYIYALDNLGAGVSNLVGGKMRLASDVTDEALKEEGERAVRLGQAQLRTGFQSLLLKDLSFLSQSRDAIVLRELISNDLFGKSHLHKKLFRDLGDLGENLDSTSGLLGAARTLNTLNTLSDNMFKRAIFTRELEKELATMGAEDAAQRNLSLATKEPEIFSMSTPNVSAVINETKLSSVPDEMIGRAMDKAIEFTYQRGDWERDPGFGYLANGVIRLSQSVPGSLFIPFGKYIVNQAKFAYEYLPILGWQDFGLGILDKPNVTETTLNTISNKIGKQFAGTATLGAFMMARQQFGDETTGAFEYKDPTSREMVNAEAAIGPFSVYALLADYIYRTKRDIPTETFTRDVAKAITGGQFRPNSGLENADRILRTLTAKDLESPEKVSRALAEAAGNVINGFTVGAGLFKDIAATISPDYRIIPDNERVNWFEHMVSMGLKSFPEEVREDEARRESPTRVGGLRYASPILRQVTGLSFQEARNVAELEFDRLRIPYRQIAPTKIEFDPELTNEAKKIMGEYVNREIASYINSPDYQRLPSDEEKRYHLRKEINHFRAEANNRVLNMDKYATKKDLDRVGKALFFRLSREEQAFAKTLYERNGLDLNEKKDFTTALNLLRQYKERERRRNR
jgi:hypothetical protein